MVIGVVMGVMMVAMVGVMLVGGHGKHGKHGDPAKENAPVSVSSSTIQSSTSSIHEATQSQAPEQHH